MWRTLIAATVAYGCGHPSVDAYRPAWLDKPLQSFHNDINAAARDGKKAFASLEDTRCVQYLKDYVAYVETRLRSAD